MESSTFKTEEVSGGLTVSCAALVGMLNGSVS